MSARSPLLAASLLCAATALPAVEYAPRVLSPHRADAYSMKTFAEYERWKDLEADVKVHEIYKYLADRRTGIYPMGAGAWEGSDVMYDYGFIRDPVKMINVYPVGYCDMLGPTMAGVMQRSGAADDARTVNMPGYHHVFAEAKLGDRWAYLDLDIRAVFPKADGTLASTEEARRDDALWQRESGPFFLPMDRVQKVRETYRKHGVEYRYNVHMGGHTMDYVLRRGETFTRWWQPQGDRWHHHESYNKGHRPKIIERAPRGPKCKHGEHFTDWTRGNGRFQYQPTLSSADDVADGIYDANNVAAGADGLSAQEEERGFVVFEVRSPYIIVPLVEDYKNPDDDHGASVVEIAGESVTASVSLDYGKSWSDVAFSEGSADLTAHAAGRYQYLIKFDIEPDGVLKELAIDTWVQAHPASLPALREGENQMRYVTGDHHDQQTRVMEIRPFANDRDELLKWCAVLPKDYKPERKTSRIRGDFVVEVPAPPQTEIAWFSAGGNFQTHQRGGAAKTDNRMAWSTDLEGDSQEFHRSEIPTYQSHWHYNADVEVMLEEPSETVYVHYHGNPGVNNIRIYAHCIDRRNRPDAPVQIRHVWKQGGEQQEHSETLDGEGAYQITCEGDPENVLVELSVPSAAAR